MKIKCALAAVACVTGTSLGMATAEAMPAVGLNPIVQSAVLVPAIQRADWDSAHRYYHHRRVEAHWHHVDVARHRHHHLEVLHHEHED